MENFRDILEKFNLLNGFQGWIIKLRTSHNDEMTNYLCKSISTSKVDVGNYRFPLTISDSFRDKSNNLARPDFRYINAWRSVEDSPMRTILIDSR